MRLINSSVEILTPQNYNLTSILKHIERCGRTCYQSFDKITDDSYVKFIEMIQNRGHLSVLEHGTIYLRIPDDTNLSLAKYNIICNKYTKHETVGKYLYVTTNLRVIKENNLEGLMQYICEPTKYHHRRTTVKFILPIGISREFCRHRVFSFSEQSTRYCNFSLDRFNNEITFIKPYWLDPENKDTYEIFMDSCRNSELNYFQLITKDCKPQGARDILPLSTKSELIMTGFNEDWKEFFKLRNHPTAHPDAQHLASIAENLIMSNN